jgi:hypothetical protein
MSGFTLAQQVSQLSKSAQVISAGKGDVVRVAQAQSYIDLYGVDGAGMLATMGLTEEEAVVACKVGIASFAKSRRDAIHAQMANLPKSHIWLKGAAATALCLMYLRAQEAQEQLQLTA